MVNSIRELNSCDETDSFWHVECIHPVSGNQIRNTAKFDFLITNSGSNFHFPKANMTSVVSFFCWGWNPLFLVGEKKVQVALMPSWRGSDSEPHGTLDSTIPLPHSAGYDGPVLLLGYSRLCECWNWWDFYPKKGVEEKSKFQAAVGEWMLKILLDGTYSKPMQTLYKRKGEKLPGRWWFVPGTNKKTGWTTQIYMVVAQQL